MKRKSKTELIKRQTIQSFRSYVVTTIIDHYFEGDLNPIHGDDLISSYIDKETGGKRGSEKIRAFCQSDVNSALKLGLRSAIKDGVPGVLVTDLYFEILDENPDILNAIETPEDAAQYVAGAGTENEAVGVLYIYPDNDDNPFLICADNHIGLTVNGTIQYLRDRVEAAIQKNLPGYNEESEFVKAVRGLPNVPLLKKDKEEN